MQKSFEHEAHAVSALNHPNICTLHDIGSQENTLHYLVMEFLSGETLRDRPPFRAIFPPTKSKITDAGTIMGTVGYMSPEQVRGIEVDHKSDLFSVGVILYEALTGKRAYERETLRKPLRQSCAKILKRLQNSIRTFPQFWQPLSSDVSKRNRSSVCAGCHFLVNKSNSEEQEIFEERRCKPVAP